MRCLGRLISLAVLVVLAAAAWWYRDQLRAAVDHALHRPVVVAHVGRPSAAAMRNATMALDRLRRGGQDSVIITADEFAALLAQGAGFLPGVTFDSLSVELGDGRIAVRTVIDSARIPSVLRSLLPGAARRQEEVRLAGPLAPVRPGLAEFAPDRFSIHGIPLPHEVAERLAQQLTGRSANGRLDITLPASVAGFRVHPASVTLYRTGSR